ncbi:MAG: hypothetical protein IAE87_17240 [Rhodobacteraceae bacterium]|jgi:hypothetical protein|nr:hypothetical protein [Paracoccaceae bacterium]
MKDERLPRLIAMAAMVLDAKSAALRKTQAACTALKAQREALDRPAPEPADLGAARAALAYEAWAAVRRAEIDARLAVQEAQAKVQMAEARRAFGRHLVLERMAGMPR